MQKTVLKVSIHCQKCKRDVLKAVAKLTGVDQMTVDEGKGTLTVVGDVDPVSLAETLRKSVKYEAKIESVGPPKSPERPGSPLRIITRQPVCVEYQLVPLCPVPCDSCPCFIL